MIEFLSVLILVFALTLTLLGLVTIWLERRTSRWQGIVSSILGLLLGAGYALLGSRFSTPLFGRLIVRVDWPALIRRLATYTVGILAGIALATSLFLWVSGQYHSWHIRRRVLALVVGASAVAILVTFLAIWLSCLV
ncbi:MAG: hypothetical protein JW900_03885 [Anaerolineae bacterium]|nr:hypothetical protein [Anaerolineae bacterium]